MWLEAVTEATSELVNAFQRLVPQLTKNNPPPSLEQLTALVKSESSTLLIARAEDSSILGGLSLNVYRVPTGIRSIIEDVIVDESARGQGIGEALLRRAMDIAKEKGAAQITLTSNPNRDAANRLYIKLGFKKRETNAYIYKF
jgi:ribosomal protein S18 acetylase RimI-like enzyme